MNRIIMSLIAIATFTCFYSCGKKDKDDKGGNGSTGQELTQTEQITGEWDGIYVALSDGKPFGEWRTITALFNADGTFHLKLNNDTSATVSGQWNQFQGTSMIWTISESTISPIGVSNQVVQPDYALEGNGLKIKSDRFEIRLPRKHVTEDSQPGSGGTPANTGTWNCSAERRQSKVIIEKDQTFTLSSISPGERAFVARGTVSLSSNGGIYLSPLYVSDQIPEGSHFELRQVNRDTQLIFIGTNAKESTLGICSK